jgi:hypothetical protein
MHNLNAASKGAVDHLIATETGAWETTYPLTYHLKRFQLKNVR